MNITPNNTVISNPNIVSFLFPLIIALCAHVANAPDANNIAVFNNGTPNASNGTIPTGGHWLPNSTVGTNAEWKNAQNNDMNKHTSDKINNNIPNLNPLCTTNVCAPKYVPSLITSLNHTYNTKINNTNDNNNNFSPNAYLWKYIAVPTANPNTLIEPTIGQGLGSTK